MKQNEQLEMIGKTFENFSCKDKMGIWETDMSKKTAPESGKQRDVYKFSNSLRGDHDELCWIGLT